MKLNDKQKRSIEKFKGIDSTNDFFWDDKTGIAKFVRGKLSKPSNDEPETVARAFLEDNTGLLDLQEDLNETLEVSQVEKDKQGFSHVYFAQSLNGIPVLEGSTQVHINPAGEVIAYKDYRLASLDVSLKPRITWIGDLRVLLVSPSGVEVTLHDRSGRSRNDIKRTYSTTTDEVMLALIGTDIQGDW